MGSSILILSFKFTLIRTFILFSGFGWDYAVTLEHALVGKMEIEICQDKAIP